MPFRVVATLALVALAVFAETLRVPGVPEIGLLRLGINPYVMGVGLVAFFTLLGKNPTGGYGKKRLLGAGVALVLAAIQALFWFSWARHQGVHDAAIIIPSLVGGAVGMAVAATAITELGIGNGVTLLLAVSGLSRLVLGHAGAETWLVLVAATLVALPLVRAPIKIAVSAPHEKFLELPAAIAGIVPVSMATALAVLPGALLTAVGVHLDLTSPWIQLPLVAAFAVFFTFFVVALTFNPVAFANRFKEEGLLLPGVEPGKPTADALERIGNGLALRNGIALAAVAVAPPLVALGTGLDVKFVWWLAPFLAAVVWDLRDEVAAPSKDLVVLGEARTLLDARRLRNVLAANGIPALVRGTTSRVLVLEWGLYVPLRVLVPRSDEERARALAAPFLAT